MRRSYRTMLLLALMLAALAVMGGEATNEDDLDRFGPNPYRVPTPAGTWVPVTVFAVPQVQGTVVWGQGSIPGVTVTVTDHAGNSQTFITRDDQTVSFQAEVGQQYTATASYGASTATAVLTIVSFGDPAVLRDGPLGGSLQMIASPDDQTIADLHYEASMPVVEPDPRLSLPTPDGTPVPVRLWMSYLGSTTPAHPLGMRITLSSDTQKTLSRVVDESGPFLHEKAFELLAGHEYTVVVDWNGQTTSEEVLVTSAGPSRKYAAGGVLYVQMDPLGSSVIDIRYESAGIL